MVEGEEAPNAEWQEHTVVTDATGVKICLDCPSINSDEAGNTTKPAAIIN